MGKLRLSAFGSRSFELRTFSRLLRRIFAADFAAYL